MHESKTAYQIKTATAAGIAAHLKDCAADFIPSLDQRVDIDAYAAKLFAKAISFEAWINGQLIGLIACYFNGESSEAYITSVSVSKNFQGEGIALQLLKNCLTYGQKVGINTVKLEVNKKNQRAIRFYEKNGFAIIEEQGGSFFMRLPLKETAKP